MKWDDKAIILSARRLGESSAIIHLLTPNHGMYKGVDRGAFSKRKRGVCQPGNIVQAHWQARLSEQLGTLECELMTPIAAHILDDRRKLAALSSAAMLAEKVLSEREQLPGVYDGMEQFVQALREDNDWLSAYVRLEFILLEQAGFGLDLERCAATGQHHDLSYVSPKSGRAVSREAGKPYHDRLFALPQFLLPLEEKAMAGMTDILDGVRLCGYFLENRVFAPRGASIPAARSRFIEMLHIEEPAFG